MRVCQFRHSAKVTLGYAAHSGADLSGRVTINILPARRKLSNLRRAVHNLGVKVASESTAIILRRRTWPETIRKFPKARTTCPLANIDLEPLPFVVQTSPLQLRAQINIRFQHLGYRAIRFRTLGNLLECRIVCPRHLANRVKMNRRNGPTGIEFFQTQRGGSLDARRR